MTLGEMYGSLWDVAGVMLGVGVIMLGIAFPAVLVAALLHRRCPLLGLALTTLYVILAAPLGAWLVYNFVSWWSEW